MNETTIRVRAIGPGRFEIVMSSTPPAPAGATREERPDVFAANMMMQAVDLNPGTVKIEGRG